VEGWTIDARFLLRGAELPRFSLVIVAIDEASFQMMGDLNGENVRTWPRQRWAGLVEIISSGNPHVIGLDVVFDTPGWDPGGDDALALALSQAGNVVLAGHMQEAGGAGYQQVTYSPPVSILASQAAGVGVVNLPADVDGGIRREKPVWFWGEQALPSFATSLAGIYAGGPINIRRGDLGTDFSLPIHYRGPEATFQTVSMYSVWSGETPVETFRDAIVLVGFTTQIEQDRHPAPFQSELGLPGVEIQANIVDTLLAGDWLHRLQPWMAILVVLASGLLALAAGNLPRAGLGWAVLALMIAAYGVLSAAMFAWGNLLLPLAAPVMAALVTGSVTFLERLVFAERDKRLLRQRFAGVMSPERLQAVLDNWEALLDTERPEKEAAVLFADLRGFTHATEFLMRQGRSPEMVRFLNAYLDAMSMAVFREGGVVYRTFGDGLLVLFGLPEPLPDHPLRAVRAALRMSLETPALQDLWPMQADCPFQMGIGINDGPMVDAIVGRGRRFDYTVLGDAVNTAARIESYCKEVMAIAPPPNAQVPETVTILLDERLYQKVRNQVIVDDCIPPFGARGKSEPVRVVRLLGLQGELEGYEYHG